MTHEKFRKVTMVAPSTVGGGLAIVTPAGNGDLVQFMPAAHADAMRDAELSDIGKPEKEKQRIFFKNGIQKIGTSDYYAHTVTTDSGQSVTEYRTDVPAPVAAKTAAAAQQPLDAVALGTAIAQGLFQAQKQVEGDRQQATAQQAEQRIADSQQAQTTQPVANEGAALVNNTTAANERAEDSGTASNPVGISDAENAAATGSSLGNDASQSDSGTDKTDADTDKTDSKPDSDATKTDAQTSTAKAEGGNADTANATAKTTQSGRPGPKARTAPVKTTVDK